MKGMSKFTRHSTRISPMEFSSSPFVGDFSLWLHLLGLLLCLMVILPFKFTGWHNDRIINMPSTGRGRVIFVLDGDPLVHKKKVSINFLFLDFIGGAFYMLILTFGLGFYCISRSMKL